MGEKIGITLYFYSREASFKCILEEEQRVVWREFFSLRQVKRSFQAKFSFSLVQPKPNVWADLAKIPHAFGTVLHTTYYYTPDTRCVVSVCSATAAMPSSSFTSSRPGLLLWFRSAKTEFLWPTCWGHLCKSKLSKKKIRQIGSQITILNKKLFYTSVTFYHYKPEF